VTEHRLVGGYGPGGDLRLCKTIQHALPPTLSQVAPERVRLHDLPQVTGQHPGAAFGEDQSGVTDYIRDRAAGRPGTPQAIASTMTRPNCSFQLGLVSDGTTSTSMSW